MEDNSLLIEQSAEEVVQSPEESSSRDSDDDAKEISVNGVLVDDDNLPNKGSHNNDEDIVIIEVESGVTPAGSDEYGQL